ncbi:aryl-sulfate sulfotransferase [bacterium]|nr:aryl-sulfate sulfotransferase [bacterium]
MKTIVLEDNRTLNVKPTREFIPEETVTVTVRRHIGGAGGGLADSLFRFIVSADYAAIQNEPKQAHVRSFQEGGTVSFFAQGDTDPLVVNGISIPSDFPFVTVMVNQNPDQNPLFFSNLSDENNGYYTMIVGNDGYPVWYNKTLFSRIDFKLQSAGLLTMWSDNKKQFIGVDGNGVLIDTYSAPPGYVADNHELQVLADGHYFLIAVFHRIVDMSSEVVGGNAAATVKENCVIEMDSLDNPVLIWRSCDYYQITDASHVDLTQDYIDYVHINSIAVDNDENILISARNLDEVTKIDRFTGKIMWRLGGRHNTFTWTNDYLKFSYQHDIRVLPNGNYTIFDNGCYHNPHRSRGIELKIDTLANEVAKVWEFYHPNINQSRQMGNVQRLNSGHTIIGWGDWGCPLVTEVDREGNIAFEARFVEPALSYRVFRFPWTHVNNAPFLLIEPHSDRITLLFNKFGDNDVHSYLVYSGVSPQPNQVVASTKEPFIHLTTELVNNTTNYFRVTAFDQDQNESGFSNEISCYVALTETDTDLLLNGDFSQNIAHWAWILNDHCSASWAVTGDDEFHFSITDGGSLADDVQLIQQNIRLFKGRTYILAFDAYAENGRLFEVKIHKRDSPSLDYSKMGPQWLTRIKQHFAHTFTMDSDSDTDAVFAILAGGSNYDVYVDNITLTAVVIAAPVADFSADIRTGECPLQVQFQDDSENMVTNWQWNFGDGHFSNEQSPTHLYNLPGVYTVTLTVTGPGGIDTRARNDYIIVREKPPYADFTADTLFGVYPLTVQFTDESSGTIAGWSWHFGDGDTSSTQHPEHTYLYADSFSVGLTVSGPGGSDCLVRDGYIVVTEPSFTEDINGSSPHGFFLHQNYPNPFNAQTTIEFDLAASTFVKIQVFTPDGRCVETIVDDLFTAGRHKVVWDGSAYYSGVYLIRMSTGSYRRTTKSLLLK